MIDPSINFVVERLYRQALAEIRVENPQRAIGHTKALEIRAIGHTQWRRPAKLQCLAVVPVSAAIVTDGLQVPSKLPMANRALRINLDCPAQVCFWQ